jgi:hypothetical protein
VASYSEQTPLNSLVWGEIPSPYPYACEVTSYLMALLRSEHVLDFDSHLVLKGAAEGRFLESADSRNGLTSFLREISSGREAFYISWWWPPEDLPFLKDRELHHPEAVAGESFNRFAFYTQAVHDGMTIWLPDEPYVGLQSLFHAMVYRRGSSCFERYLSDPLAIIDALDRERYSEVFTEDLVAHVTFFGGEEPSNLLVSCLGCEAALARFMSHLADKSVKVVIPSFEEFDVWSSGESWRVEKAEG